jgi:hypothetical protein
MAYRRIVAGSTSQIIEFPIYDSSSTIGATLAGLVYNTASLTAYYNRQGAAGSATAMSLVTMTKGTWVSLGFIAVDAVNIPGVYQLGIPDAAIAAGVSYVTICLKGAANMVPLILEIELTSVSDYPSNMTQIGGAAISTSTAQLGVNTVSLSSGAITESSITDSSISVNKVTQGVLDKVWASASRTMTAFGTTLGKDVWDVLTSALITSSSIGKKVSDWILGTDNKALLSTDAQSGVTIPTVTTITNRVTANADQINGVSSSALLGTDHKALLSTDAQSGVTIPTVTTITNRVTANADQINSSSTAAQNLALSAATITACTVKTANFSPTTTQFETDSISMGDTDFYKNRWVIFTSGNLITQARLITGYSYGSSYGRFTCSAFTQAPVLNNTFLIV